MPISEQPPQELVLPAAARTATRTSSISDTTDCVIASRDWSPSAPASSSTRRCTMPTGSARSIEIDAGLPLGPGSDTTAGCLAALDGLEVVGKRLYRRHRTGTGFLLAVMALWPSAGIATDIDGRGRVQRECRDQRRKVGRVGPVAAGGRGRHGSSADRRPRPTCCANILAGPLIERAQLCRQRFTGRNSDFAGLLDTGRCGHCRLRAQG